MLMMLLNTLENSQNTDAKGVWYRPFTSVGNRQNGFLQEGASVTLYADVSLNADWWTT